MSVSPNLHTITILNINQLHSPIKRHIVAEYVFLKKDLTVCSLTLALKVHIGWKWRNEKKIFGADSNQNSIRTNKDS
jgi:hypothetical protein